ncbi:MAG: protein kinase [Gemmatimonadales bacterium]|nr:protein kinase [Gemmatimonadales bacterium]
MTAPSAALTAALGARYRLDGELGRGGMGVVWRAHDTQLGRDVAIKVLAPHVVGEAAERFLREIRLLATLQHPHIVPLFDAGIVGETAWYSMPLVEGESLGERLGRGPVPAAETVSLLRDVAGALDAAHARGVVHRDVKPANILLSGGRALLADFGVAGIVAAATGDGAERLTGTGAAVGSLAYMAPEQLTAGAAEARTDQFGLACVAYELLAGHSLFDEATAASPARSPAAALAARLTGAVPPLPAERGLPAAVHTVLSRALAPEPGARFESCGAFVAALATALETPAPTPARRVSGRTAGIAAGVLAAAAIAVLLARGTGGAGRSDDDGEPLARTSDMVQLTSNGGSFAPSFGPDGRALLYALKECAPGGACTFAAEIRGAPGEAPRRIADGFELITRTTWSPDGRWVLLQAQRAGVMGMYLVPALGGPTRFVGRGLGSFLGSGDSLLVAPFETPRGVARARVLTTADTVTRDTITVRGNAPNALALFEASPSGGLVAFTTVSGGSQKASILRRDGTVADTLRLLRTPAASSAWRWTREGDALVWALPDTVVRNRVDIVFWPVDPASGRVTGPLRTVLRHVASGHSRVDIAAGTRDLVLDVGAPRFAALLVERDAAGRLRTTPWRTRTVPLYAAMRPDGRAIALVEAGADSVFTLLLHDLPSGTDRQVARLTDLVSGGAYTGSPELRWVGDDAVEVLQRRPDGRVSLLAVDVRTGRSQVMAVLPPPTIAALPMPGGAVVALRHFETRLVRVHADGRADSLDLPSAAVTAPLDAVALDASRMALFVVDDARSDFAIWEVNWSTRRVTRLAAVPYSDGQPSIWQAAGTVHVASMASEGQLTLFRLDAGRQAPTRLATLAAAGLSWPRLSLSANQSRGVLFGVDVAVDLWSVPGALANGRR